MCGSGAVFGCGLCGYMGFVGSFVISGPSLWGLRMVFFFCSGRRRHTRCALVTGVQTCALPISSLPSFIDPADPLIRYQGGPPDWTVAPNVATYLSNPFTVSQYSRYFLISPINRSLLSPKLNGATGNALQVLVSYAETCFYIAEFIEKGYGSGVNTGGTAEDWYKKGVASSIRVMNEIALEAQSETAFSGNGEAEINASLADPDVQLNGRA